MRLRASLLQAPLAKAALQCLSQLLAALDPAAWLQAVPAVNQLLAFAMDARPKVRKRAAQGLVEMMAGLQHSVALASASELVAKGVGKCMYTLFLFMTFMQHLHQAMRRVDHQPHSNLRSCVGMCLL